MNVDLTPEQNTFVQRAIRSGRIGRPEEAAQEAFELWVERERVRIHSPFNRANAQAAAASIRKLREGVTLGDLKMEDLIAEGRR